MSPRNVDPLKSSETPVSDLYSRAPRPIEVMLILLPGGREGSFGASDWFSVTLSGMRVE